MSLSEEGLRALRAAVCDPQQARTLDVTAVVTAGLGRRDRLCVQVLANACGALTASSLDPTCALQLWDPVAHTLRVDVWRLCAQLCLQGPSRGEELMLLYHILKVLPEARLLGDSCCGQSECGGVQALHATLP